MKLLFFSICTFVLLTHLLFLNKLEFSFEKPDDEKKQKGISIRIRKSKSKIEKNNSKKVRHKGFGLSSLSLANVDLSNSSKVSENSSSFSSAANTLWSKVSEALSYPEEFSAIKIKGKVIAKIYLNEEGLFVEKHSRFKCENPFLCVHVRRLLRKALKYPIKLVTRQRGYYKAIFDFHLASRPLSKRELTLRESVRDAKYFYEHQYGEGSDYDKVAIPFFKALGSIQNIFSLIEQIPSIKEHKKAKVKKLLESYREDRYWMQEDVI